MSEGPVIAARHRAIDVHQFAKVTDPKIDEKLSNIRNQIQSVERQVMRSMDVFNVRFKGPDDIKSKADGGYVQMTSEIARESRKLADLKEKRLDLIRRSWK